MTRQSLRYLSWCLFLLLNLAFSSAVFAENNDKHEKKHHHATKLSIKKAKYKHKKHRVEIKLHLKGKKPFHLFIFDAKTNQLLAERKTRDDSPKIKLTNLSGGDVPCKIRVTLPAASLEKTKSVKHAPDNCSSGSTPPPPPPPPTNQPPVCKILEPAGDVSIALGDSVYFRAEATDPENQPLQYEWDFNGGADTRPAVVEPGNVIFDVNNGSFLVHFIATDAEGARCTDSLTVTVGTAPPPPTNGMVPQQPAPGSTGAGDGRHVVLPANDLGMHCADLGSYPFNILPPFNTINAYAIKKGIKPLILDASSVSLRYSAASNPNDPVGPNSINSTSQNFPLGSGLANASIRKTDFWDDFNNTGNSIVSLLFPGLNPAPDEGLLTLDNLSQGHGRFMPGIQAPYLANDPQDFSQFVPETGWHTAQGIPMTNVDDSGRLNSYPMLRIQAVDNQTGQVVATTDVVAPVSAEVDCRDCHTAGQVGADTSARANGPQFMAPASADRLDVERAAKENILMLHDFKHNTDFISQDKPVLCASCHRSNALATVGGPAGDPNVKNMSNVMHSFHGRLQTDASGALLRDFQGEPILIDPPQQNQAIALIPFGPNVPMEENCFQCHPGKVTQCFRGAMFTAERKCDDCHGNLLAIGGEFSYQDGHVREPWAEEPRCGSCHSGIGSDPVAEVAYNPNDPAAEPLAAKTSRFAENPGTLYRNSLDNHANLGCESCHGSPHAIWPNRNPNANDNVTAMQLQGHKGTITECTACHEPGSFPNGTLKGPHGTHPFNDPDWNDEDGHGHFAERNNQQCNSCHGDDHLGTRLAKVPVDRVLKDKKGKILTTLKAGDVVSCNLCHSLKKSFSD